MGVGLRWSVRCQYNILLVLQPHHMVWKASPLATPVASSHRWQVVLFVWKYEENFLLGIESRGCRTEWVAVACKLIWSFHSLISSFGKLHHCWPCSLITPLVTLHHRNKFHFLWFINLASQLSILCTHTRLPHWLFNSLSYFSWKILFIKVVHFTSDIQHSTLPINMDHVSETFFLLLQEA